LERRIDEHYFSGGHVGYEYSVTDIYHKIEKASKDTHDKLYEIAGNATGINSRLDEVRQHVSGFSKPLGNVGKEVFYVRIGVWIIAICVVAHVIHHW
jgi:hypothetical protein